MIAFLSGTVAARGLSDAVIAVGGVGFRVHMTTRSLATLPTTGDDVMVHTYLHVREGEMTLYGFESPAERVAFEMLLTVNGVGPKVALATLSALPPEDLASAVAAEDVSLVSSVPGVGKKTAQRIILDLADKLGSEAGQTPSPSGAGSAAMAEAREALGAMGFTPAETALALKGLPAGASPNEVLQSALRRLGGTS